MGLVDYASSEDDDDQNENEQLAATTVTAPTALKRKREEQREEEGEVEEWKEIRKAISSSNLPPLPPRFRDLYVTAAKLSTRDDPSLHGGRKRATPHIQGNWPTHLYIEWYPSPTEHNLLSKLISALQSISPAIVPSSTIPSATIHSFLTSDLGASLPLHISLSRPIGLSTEQKDAFLSSLQYGIKSSRIRPFEISFTGLDWVPNFDKTRWFLVLRIQRPVGDELNKLLHICNAVAREYNQPPLYAESKPTIAAAANRDARKRRSHTAERRAGPECESMVIDVSDAFHVSIAWALESPLKEVVERTRRVQGSGEFEDVREGIRVRTEEVKAKIGNVVTSIPLPSLRR
ncbi:hypothetical protein B7463_g7959, partial [Scytalidium lignicola]